MKVVFFLQSHCVRRILPIPGEPREFTKFTETEPTADWDGTRRFRQLADADQTETKGGKS